MFGADWNGDCIGDRFLKYLGLKAWSNGEVGLHYTAVVSLVMMLVAFIIYSMTTVKKMVAFRRFLAGVLVIYFLGSVVL